MCSNNTWRVCCAACGAAGGFCSSRGRAESVIVAAMFFGTAPLSLRTHFNRLFFMQLKQNYSCRVSGSAFSLQECVCKPLSKRSSAWLRKNTSPSRSTSKWHRWSIFVSITWLPWTKSAWFVAAGSWSAEVQWFPVTQTDLTWHQPHIHPSWTAWLQLVNLQMIEIIAMNGANSPGQNWELTPRYMHVLQEERQVPEFLPLIMTIIYFSFFNLCSSESPLQAPVLK